MFVLTAITLPMIFGFNTTNSEPIPNEVSIAALIFNGEWCNKDFSTGGITRVHIRSENKNLKIHMWGRCHPKECDWGETISLIHDNGQLLTVKWNHSFVITTQKLRIMPDSTLEVSSHTHFTDNSGRSDRDDTYYFKKGLTHDWSDKDADTVRRKK